MCSSDPGPSWRGKTPTSCFGVLHCLESLQYKGASGARGGCQWLWLAKVEEGLGLLRSRGIPLWHEGPGHLIKRCPGYSGKTQLLWPYPLVSMVSSVLDRTLPPCLCTAPPYRPGQRYGGDISPHPLATCRHAPGMEGQDRCLDRQPRYMPPPYPA